MGCSVVLPAGRRRPGSPAAARRLRGETVQIGDVFAGFRLAFVQLLLAGFVCHTALMAGLIDNKSTLDESTIRKAIADIEHD